MSGFSDHTGGEFGGLADRVIKRSGRARARSQGDVDRTRQDQKDGFAAYEIDPDHHVGSDDPIDTPELQAELSRQQVRLFDSHFQPYEDDMMGLVSDEDYADRMARRAHDLTTVRVDQTGGQAERQASRYGARLTARDQHRGERQQGLMAATVGAGAANEQRQSARDHQIQVGRDMGQIGQQLSERATRLTGQAADMYRDREREYQQMKAEAESQPSGLLGWDTGIL